ncbi:hypothetical protein GL263_24860, partial [Streptomyces durbertensis]
MRAAHTAEQGRRIEAGAHPDGPGLRSLLPGGAVRPGITISTCGDLPLLLALAAEAAHDLGGVGAAEERGGAWAVIGLPELGALAAAGAGLDLGAGMWVDDPGRRWAEVTATALEAVPVVLLRAPARVAPRTGRRLAALLRRNGSALVVAGSWPGAELQLRVTGADWQGIGDGDGLLLGRRARVVREGRGAAGGADRAA